MRSTRSEQHSEHLMISSCKISFLSCYPCIFEELAQTFHETNEMAIPVDELIVCAQVVIEFPKLVKDTVHTQCAWACS
jgi:hypothetical protein